MQDLTSSERVQIEKVSVPLVPNLGTKESASGSISDHLEKLPANDVMVNDAQGKTLGHLATVYNYELVGTNKGHVLFARANVCGHLVVLCFIMFRYILLPFRFVTTL